MGWQLPLVLLIVAVAASYLVWQVWRSWRGSRSGCAGGCGCAKNAAPASSPNVTLIPADQLTIRRRDPASS
jgi:hypothetical protein